jgi:uncharacterized membrane protein
MPKISEEAWRGAAAIAVSVIVVGAVAGILVGPVAGIIAGLVTLPVAIALDWETRRRRELTARSKATEGD